ncbi:MAG: choice-of-anchor D domain-containing protein [Deltaproteobacteria bacterium]|nr:choice-of-anchor D domain-containing protein [Deltaproteobacteria bacterium]
MLALLTLLACNQDTGLQILSPEISVVPEALDFTEQIALLPAEQIVSVSNAGLADLEVQASLEGSEAFELLSAQATVPPGRTWELGVRFTAPSYLDYSGTLTLSSNDEETPVVEVPLRGTGVHAPQPDIALEPLAVDFGVVPQGSFGSAFLIVRNEGDGELHLGSVQQQGSGAFSLSTDPSGATISAGGEVPVVLSYRPTQDQGDTGALVFPSDDPDEPRVEVLLLGNGGGDLVYPEAVIDCPGQLAPPVWVDLDGSGSSDPEGNTPLSFQWSLTEQPTGSHSSLTQDSTETTRFFADAAGSWEAQLVVTNTLGLASAPARCQMLAVPEEALHVELTWDTPAADLDLHLLDAGAEFFERPGDCNYCNQTPHWGATGTDDDPRLALDDRGGYGPENIKLLDPASGTYRVRVHYFEEHGDEAVVATVRVYLHGALEAEVSKVIHRNQVWDVGEVRWPAATFGVETTALWEPGVRSCW